MQKPMSHLTPQQECFVHEYLIDLNASAAYSRAGYAAKGNSIAVNASKLLRVPKVQQAVQKAMDERAQRMRIDGDQVLANIARITETAEKARDFSAALKGNELIGKHLELFTDKVKMTGNVTVEITRFGAPKSEGT